MFRVFKHYVPHSVLVLGILDFILLFVAADTAWVIRAGQIGMYVQPLSERWMPIASFAGTLQMAMVAIGVYGIDALLSLRFAAARLLVAVSLGMMLMAIVHFIFPETTLWRSNALYALGISYAALMPGWCSAGCSAMKAFAAVCWFWVQGQGRSASANYLKYAALALPWLVMSQ
jgi:hypothetical protein